MEHPMFKNPLLPVALVAGICIIIAFVLGARIATVNLSSNTITVVGSTTKQVKSDTIKWNADISRVVKLSAVKDGYNQVASDLVQVKAYLKASGIPDESVVIGVPQLMQNYDTPQYAEKEYTVSQSVTINGVGDEQISKITDLAKNNQTLLNKGVMFITRSVDYLYSKLPEERVAMLADAVKDAKSRAITLAQSAGGTIGNLRSASAGVVQVLPLNSIQISDYGTYDTSSIDKNIMVTVRTVFTVK
ncbi:MAG: SIMPL domain-containing protein [Minisyncoccia bacterium]